MTKNQISAVREGLYGGPSRTGPKFHYVAYLNGIPVGTGASKEAALAAGAQALLDALDKQTSSIYATVASDGSVCTTREYAPGQVQFAHHRAPDGRDSGICMSRLEVDGKRVSAAEYHRHYVAAYCDAIAPKGELTKQEMQARKNPGHGEYA
jgi:hypothetical protein